MKVTPLSHILCIVQLITSTNDITDNLIGQYAKIFKDKCSLKGFNFASVNYRADLIGNAKMQVLVKLIVFESIVEKDGK